MWRWNRDEFRHKVRKFKRENPSDQSTKVVADDRHRLNIQSFEEIFQLTNDDIWSVIVAPNRLIRVIETFKI